MTSRVLPLAEFAKPRLPPMRDYALYQDRLSDGIESPPMRETNLEQGGPLNPKAGFRT